MARHLLARHRTAGARDSVHRSQSQLR